MSEQLQQQIDDLTARVTALEQQRWTGPPRLGPKPPSDEEVAERTQRLVDGVRADMAAAKDVPPVDRSKVCTTNGKTAAEVRASQTNETGQHDGYIALCPDERAKGFVRPLRRSYKHVGERPTHPTRPLTSEEQEWFAGVGYVAFERYPDDSASSISGRYWTQAQLDSGCGTVTSMGLALCETYARDPSFYWSTFCVGCNRHLPVAEFVWSEDGQRVGS